MSVPQSVVEGLASAVAIHPDRPAVVWPVDDVLADLTYAELSANAHWLAQRLAVAGAGGGVVAVWAQNSADWLVLEYACALAGTALVPINPALTDDECAHVLTSARPSVLFCQDEFRGSRLDVRAQRIAGGLGADCRVVVLDRWHDLPTDDALELPPVDPSTTLLVQFTSGTTGRPKGALLTQRAAFGAAATSVARLAPGAHEVWCSPMPLHHVGGSVSVALSVLAVAGTLVLMPAFTPEVAIDLVARSGATILGAVPTMMIDILESPSRAGSDLSSLRVIQIGGSTVTPQLIDRMQLELGVSVVNAYGQSEAPNAAQTSLSADRVTKAETIGTVNPGREARVVDPVTGTDCATGIAGELLIRSPFVMSGYLDDPVGTEEVLDTQGWLHTGDLVTMDASGVLRFTGRVRDVIISGGENVYPAEIEAVVSTHVDVLEVAVVGVPDDRRGEVPAAFVRGRDGVELDATSLQEHCLLHLAPFKTPRIWTQVEEFPRTAAGKIKRFELRGQRP